MPRLLLILLLTLASAACGSRPVVEARSLPSSVKTHRQEVLDRQLVAEIVGERDGDAYRVGPGDTLLVAVYGHPETATSNVSPGPTR